MAPERPQNLGPPDEQPSVGEGVGPSSSPSADGSGVAERSQLPGPTLPRGGGAIHPTDEKYDVDLATGTGSAQIEIETPGGRGPHQLDLVVQYDSSGGNSEFGVGWSLGGPRISRKTANRLPRYEDGRESDVFVLSGAEDLVPKWDAALGERVRRDAPEYVIHEYIPRVEGPFARIERLTRRADGDVHWRVTTTDNIRTTYGGTGQARIVDPEDPTRIFAWLIERTEDTFGHITSYLYKPEDLAGVASSQAHEAHRVDGIGPGAQKYLKRVRYGNRVPRLPSLVAPSIDPVTGRPEDEEEWLFEIVFDYGEHPQAGPKPDESGDWAHRADAFSDYRSGFEIRTRRLCRRVLVFHRLPGLGRDPALVRSTDFAYDERPHLTRLTAATRVGYAWDSQAVAYESKSAPPLRFGYTDPVLTRDVRSADPASVEDLPVGAHGPSRLIVDLDGDGIPGILSEEAGAWYYKRNLGPVWRADGSAGPIRFAPRKRVEPLPGGVRLQGGFSLADFDGDGRLSLLRLTPKPAGFNERVDGTWDPLTPFARIPNIDWRDRTVHRVDLTGDGNPDLLITESDVFRWYPAEGREGFGEEGIRVLEGDEDRSPRIVLTDRRTAILFADFSGDGLPDLIRIRNREICYWPNLGFGRFGAKVVMDDPPEFDADGTFDPKRLRVADLDGSGPADLIYLHRLGAHLWRNLSGNGWSFIDRLDGVPSPDAFREVETADLLGTGTTCLAWASALPGGHSLSYVPLFGETKPNLLNHVENYLGLETRAEYRPSTRFFLEDEARGRPWRTRLPFPVWVVERLAVSDPISRVEYVRRYRYSDGFFEGREREFRGFGVVERRDSEGFESVPAASGRDSHAELPPILTRTWFHVGAADEISRLLPQARADHYGTEHLDGPRFMGWSGWTSSERREALRAIRGQPYRSETYADDGTALAGEAYDCTAQRWIVERLQPRGDQRHASFAFFELEALDVQYERDSSDPRVAQRVSLTIDPARGRVETAAVVSYPRRPGPDRLPEQARLFVTLTETDFADLDVPGGPYRIGATAETRAYDITGVTPRSGRFEVDELVTELRLAVPVDHAAPPAPGAKEKRIVERERTIYRKDDLSGPLPLGQVGSVGLTEQTYELAFDGTRLDVLDAKLPPAQRGAVLTEGGYVDLDNDGSWWIPSGRLFYSPIPDPKPPGWVESLAFADSHFFLPQGSEDPFGNVGRVRWDPFDLVPVESIDPLGSTHTAEIDYHTLTAWRVTDPNGNAVSVRTDPLGMVIAQALEGDPAAADPTQRGDTLDDATTIYEYRLDEWAVSGRPVTLRTLSREEHAVAGTRWEEDFEYYDGFGRPVQTKLRAEDGAVNGVPTQPRWAATGVVVYDRKGNVVKEYEPFFSATEAFEWVQHGKAITFFYDPLGREIAALHSDHSYEKTVFTSWREETWDRNDNVDVSDPRIDPDVGVYFSVIDSAAFLPSWRQARILGALGPEAQAAAADTLAHADTPTTVHLDSLGRVFLTEADNGVDGLQATREVLDFEGRPLEVIDALHRVTTAMTYDLLGRTLKREHVDAGSRWTLPEIEGDLLRDWDDRGFRRRHVYDKLRRPLQVFVLEPGGAAEILVEDRVYGEGSPNAGVANRNGALFEVRDGAGLLVYERYDFKGNLTSFVRTFSQHQVAPLDWSAAPALEAESFRTTKEFDALNRLRSAESPHNTQLPPTTIRVRYNDAGLVDGISARIRGAGAATDHVTDIDYDAAGRRTFVQYGNGVARRYTYDPATLRLSRLVAFRSGSIFQDYRYTYDPVGNITAIRDNAQETVYFSNQAIDAHSGFRYDALYQLVEATGREHMGQQGVAPGWDDSIRRNQPHPNDGQALRTYTRHYTYDPVGNFLTVRSVAAADSWTRDYFYDEPNLVATNNRLTRTSSGGIDSPLTYDGHGNVASAAHLQALAWDYADRLSHVDKGGGGEVWYVYDTDGNRARKVWQKSGSMVEERLYLGGFEIFRRRSNGALQLQRETVHLMEGERRVALVETLTTAPSPSGPLPATRWRYQLDNHLGSASVELDDQGAVISYEEYHPFGSTALHTVDPNSHVSPKRYRYSGKEADSETGFYYHGARYLAPWLGRWMSCDPALDDDDVLEDLGNYRAYVYVDNRPIVAVDPDGQIIWFVAAAVVVAVVATPQFANAPAPADETYSKSTGELALDMAENASYGVGAGGLVRGGARVLAAEGLKRGTVTMGKAVATGYVTAEVTTAVADTVDPSGTLGRVTNVVTTVLPGAKLSAKPKARSGTSTPKPKPKAEAKPKAKAPKTKPKAPAKPSGTPVGSPPPPKPAAKSTTAKKPKSSKKSTARPKKAWQKHEEAVTDALRKANPGRDVGTQITLDVKIKPKSGKPSTVRIRIDNMYKTPSGRYKLADAKHSGKKDLSNPGTNLRSTMTPNQKKVFDALKGKDGATVLSVTPKGKRATDFGLSTKSPIPVDPSVDVHVNNPSGGISVRTY